MRFATLLILCMARFASGFKYNMPPQRFVSLAIAQSAGN